VGLAFAFGNRGPGEPRAARNVPTRPAGEEPEESVLLGIGGVPAQAGVKVTLIRDQSVANRAGVEIDDVITAINGERVRSIRDIEIAVGKNITAGSIKVTYLTKGIASVDSTVTIVPPAK
jgi:S1-C subfamily serine protease